MLILLVFLSYTAAALSNYPDHTLRCTSKNFTIKALKDEANKVTVAQGQILHGSLKHLNGSTCSNTTEVYGSRDNVYLVTCGNCPECRLDALREDYNYILVTRRLDEIPIAKGTIAVLIIQDTTTLPLSSDDCEILEGASPTDNADALRSFSKTSVLFVSISFIILMVISLAWLVFYYVQRFRYAHAKDRLQRRLFNAAKKALARIPARSLRQGDPELDTDCPVCIDPYVANDVVRTLPCRHVFHKTCIDPWLLEHRTCPMCKGDILKAFGYQVTCGGEGSRGEEREQAREVDSPDPPSTASESAVFPFTHNQQVNDPFSYTPSSSPQLVLNSSNAKNLTLVPLTVHSKPVCNLSRDIIVIEHPPVIEHAQSSSQENVDRRPSSATPPPVETASTSGNRSIALGPVRGQGQGQVVNLVQVRSRSMSAARAATFRGRMENHRQHSAGETYTLPALDIV